MGALKEQLNYISTLYTQHEHNTIHVKERKSIKKKSSLKAADSQHLKYKLVITLPSCAAVG